MSHITFYKNYGRDFTNFMQMKLFTLLFNFYLLALAFFPCADIDTCDEENVSVASSITKDNEQKQKNVENCTPFCICACCAAPIITAAINSVESAKHKFFTYRYSYKQLMYPNETLAAVWQPPKFC